MKNSTASFIAGLEDAAPFHEVEAYAGRSYWFGPAVRCDDENDLVDVIRATRGVAVQWDTLGMGYILYPQISDKEWFDENA